MTKAEVNAKIDEIIAFSGCQKYVDTPTKRYSSGMRVRLAFAVAAHLDPEILVIDEVLAVGDVEFQKKAIGKMQEISQGEGKTVLFVSHNMASVKSLCTRGIVLENGTTVFDGTANDGVQYYLAKNSTNNANELKSRTDRFGSGDMRLINVSFKNEQDDNINQIISGDFLKVCLTFEKNVQYINYDRLFVGINFKDDQEQTVLSYLSDEMGSDFVKFENSNNIYLIIPNFNIRAGVYNLRVQTGIGSRKEDHFDTIENVASIQILPGRLWENGQINRPGNFAILPGNFII